MQNCTAVDEALQREAGLENPCFVEHLLPKLVDLVRTSRKLPVGEEYAIRRGSRDFLAASKELEEKSLAVVRQTLRFADEPAAEKGIGDLSNFNVVIDCIDNVLEDVEQCLKDAFAEASGGAAGDSGPKAPAWAAGAPPQAGSIAKPQVRWRQMIDNERTSFIPRLLVKHNKQVPLAAEIVEAQCRAGLRPRVARKDGTVPAVQEGDEAAPLPHPYEAELNAISWDESFFRIKQAERYLRMEDTPLVLVSTEQELRDMVQEIKTTCKGKEVAIDVEHHSFRSYRGIACLIQLSTRQKDFIVDPFDIFPQMHLLNEICSDPSIVKVLHGADRDVVWLQQDFSIYFVNMFDTGQATRVLKLQGGFSLANLVSHFCGVKLDKKYQTADWRERPLPQEMLEYARCDTHYLLYCYDRLKNALLASTGSSDAIASTDGDDLQVLETGLQALNVVLAKSTELSRSLYVEAPFDAEGGASQLCRRFGSLRCPLEAKNLVALRAVLAWRDRLARSLDESIQFIAPDACLWRVALALPSSASRLRSTCNPLPPTLQAHAQEVVDVIIGAPDQSRSNGAASSSSRPNAAGLAAAPAASAGASATATTVQVAAPKSLVGLPKWPQRRANALRPVVHVAAAADAEGSKCLRALGKLSAMLSTLVCRAEDAALALGAAPPLAERSAKLKLIEDAMAFIAAPPEAPPEGAFDKGDPVEAVVEEEVRPPQPQVDPEDLPPLRKRKRSGATATKKNLESIVKTLPTASDTGGALAVSDPYAAPAPAEEEEGPLADKPNKKKRKKGKRGAADARTELDPYF